MNANTNPALFQETQQFRQKWLWFILLAVAALVFGLIVSGIAEQPGVEDLPADENSQLNSGAAFIALLAMVLSIGLLYLFYALKLTTVVREDGLFLRFFPFTGEKRIRFEEIRSCEPREYHPIKEYGGWGIRYGRQGKAYTVSGNQGVHLTFAQGKPLLIGSQRANELAAAINSKR